MHRDSLGSRQVIRPGAINWMTAGRGIVHSERTDDEERARGPRVHGIQLCVALPTESEEVEPEFHHHPADTLPALERDRTRLRVLAGYAYGVTSPVHTFSPLFYVEATMEEGSQVELPEHAERAVYVAEGKVQCGPEYAEAGRMLVLSLGHSVKLEARGDARVMLLGGAPLRGERHIWWNFVSSRKERIEQAKRDWKEDDLAGCQVMSTIASRYLTDASCWRRPRFCCRWPERYPASTVSNRVRMGSTLLHPAGRHDAPARLAASEGSAPEEIPSGARTLADFGVAAPGDRDPSRHGAE